MFNRAQRIFSQLNFRRPLIKYHFSSPTLDEKYKNVKDNKARMAYKIIDIIL